MGAWPCLDHFDNAHAHGIIQAADQWSGGVTLVTLGVSIRGHSDVLFLDELGEFAPSALDALRAVLQP